MKCLSSKLTYANVMATLALFVALGGGAYAATRLPRNSVDTRQIKNGAVTPAKLSGAAKASIRGPEGPAGPRGARGEQGDEGPRGERGREGPAGLDGSSGGGDPALAKRLADLEAANASLTEKIDDLESTFAGVSRRGTTLLFSGMNLQLRNGEDSDSRTNGLGNLIIGRNHNGDGQAQTGSANIVMGDRNSFTSFGSVVMGIFNRDDAAGSFIAGTHNTIHLNGENSAILGGSGNTIGTGNHDGTFRGSSTVVGGIENVSTGPWATVLGGEGNAASAHGATAVGGRENKARGDFAFAAGYRQDATDQDAPKFGP